MTTYRLSYTKMEQIISVWNEIAKEIGGKFRNVLCSSPAIIDPIDNEIRRFELHVPTKLTTKIIITTSETQIFKVNFDFKKRLNVEFQIYPENLIEKITKFLGAREVEIGIPKFDNKYILNSDNERLMKYLLDKESIDYLLNNLKTQFSIRTEGYSKFSLVTTIHEEKKEEMMMLIQFVSQIIEKLNNWKN